MRKVDSVIAVSLCLQLAASVAPARAETAAPASAPGSTLADARFLRAEVSFWDTFGVKLSKGQAQVGPSFFSVIPNEAVAGSPDALRHTRHARVFQGVVLGLTLTSVGLFAGSLAVRSSNDDEWTQGSGWMLAGGVLALAGGYMSALARQNEMLAAINAYNHDLITGRLRE